MTNLIIREWNQKTIRQREDGYICLTDMCQAQGKKFSHWKATQDTKDFLEALSEDLDIPIYSTDAYITASPSQQGFQALIEIIKGGNPQKQGTWGHPDVALELARWLNKRFAIQCNRWIKELLTTGSVSIQNNQPVPLDYPSALRAAAEAYEQKMLAEAQSDFAFEKLEEAEDTIDGYRSILREEVGLTVSNVAKGLNIKRLGRNKLFAYLRSKNFIQKSSPEPYQSRIDEELAFVTTYSITIGSTEQVKHQTKLTFKGLEWLVKNLKNDGYTFNSSAQFIWDTYKS